MNKFLSSLKGGDEGDPPSGGSNPGGAPGGNPNKSGGSGDGTQGEVDHNRGESDRSRPESRDNETPEVKADVGPIDKSGPRTDTSSANRSSNENEPDHSSSGMSREHKGSLDLKDNLGGILDKLTQKSPNRSSTEPSLEDQIKEIVEKAKLYNGLEVAQKAIDANKKDPQKAMDAACKALADIGAINSPAACEGKIVGPGNFSIRTIDGDSVKEFQVDGRSSVAREINRNGKVIREIRGSEPSDTFSEFEESRSRQQRALLDQAQTVRATVGIVDLRGKAARESSKGSSRPADTKSRQSRSEKAPQSNPPDEIKDQPEKQIPPRPESPSSRTPPSKPESLDRFPRFERPSREFRLISADFQKASTQPKADVGAELMKSGAKGVLFSIPGLLGMLAVSTPLGAVALALGVIGVTVSGTSVLVGAFLKYIPDAESMNQDPEFGKSLGLGFKLLTGGGALGGIAGQAGVFKFIDPSLVDVKGLEVGADIGSLAESVIGLGDFMDPDNLKGFERAMNLMSGWGIYDAGNDLKEIKENVREPQ